MTRDTREELIELYTELIDSGVVFYYGNEEIDNGEITNFEINEEDIIIIEVDHDESLDLDISEFIQNHSKEGSNYHSWPMVRRFDEILSN